MTTSYFRLDTSGDIVSLVWKDARKHLSPTIFSSYFLSNKNSVVENLKEENKNKVFVLEPAAYQLLGTTLKQYRPKKQTDIIAFKPGGISHYSCVLTLSQKALDVFQPFLGSEQVFEIVKVENIYHYKTEVLVDPIYMLIFPYFDLSDDIDFEKSVFTEQRRKDDSSISKQLSIEKFQNLSEKLSTPEYYGFDYGLETLVLKRKNLPFISSLFPLECRSLLLSTKILDAFEKEKITGVYPLAIDIQ